MNNLLIIFCLAYVIVFLVVTIHNNPNFEFFDSPSPSGSSGSSGGSGGVGSGGSGNNGQKIAGFKNEDALITAIKKEIEKNKEMFYKQESEQNIQNTQIKEISQQVDKFRDDLMLFMKNENRENGNVHSSINPDDSLSQMLSVSGSSSLGNAIGGFGNAGSKGKNYNLNFNLQD